VRNLAFGCCGHQDAEPNRLNHQELDRRERQRAQASCGEIRGCPRRAKFRTLPRKWSPIWVWL